MSTATTNRRRVWTHREWRSFAARCRAARDELDAIGDLYRGTPGLTAPTIDAFLSARRRLFVAMDKLQGPIVAQHPELEGVVLGIVHGPNGWCRSAPPASPHPEPLTREEWRTLGARLKALRDELGRLGMEIQWTRGGGVGLSDRFLNASGMSRLRSKLEDLACRQHPDWEDVTHVFYRPWPAR